MTVRAGGTVPETAAPGAGRELCLMLGMCFTGALAYLLGHSPEFRRRFRVKVYQTGADRHFITEHQISEAELAAASVVIIHPPQWAGWGNQAGYAALMARLPAHLPRITFPYPTLNTLWPYHALDPRRLEPVDPWEDNNPLLYAHSDYNVLRMRMEGLSPQQIVEQYRRMDVPEMIDLEALARRKTEKERIREANTDVKVVDFVLERFAAEQVFASVNHGANPLLIHMANQMLTLLGFDPLPPTLGQRLGELMDPYIPIHPSVIRFHGLRWATSDTRYPIDRRRRLTWEEYVYQLAV